jgi:hypothetical protein
MKIAAKLLITGKRFDAVDAEQVVDPLDNVDV